MEDVEALGFVKMDLLGLRTLTVIDEAKKLAAAQGAAVPDPVPGDDPAVYAAMTRFGTEGIFQLETPMFQRLVERLQPDRFSDLVALVALGRPGPAERIDDFIRRRHGRAARALPPSAAGAYFGGNVRHHRLPGASDAHRGGRGRILAGGGGFVPAGHVGQAGRTCWQPQRERFVAGADANGVPEAVAGRIFDELDAFAGYGFNKSHSVAYALLCYETAYLRTHFPAAYFAALLSSWRGQSSSASPATSRRPARMGVRVLPPDVNTESRRLRRR